VRDFGRGFAFALSRDHDALLSPSKFGNKGALRSVSSSRKAVRRVAKPCSGTYARRTQKSRR